MTRPVRCDNLIIRLVFVYPRNDSVLKKIFHFFLDIYHQQSRKGTSPLSFQENKEIVLYELTRKKKYQVTNVPVKRKIVTFLLVNVYKLNLDIILSPAVKKKHISLKFARKQGDHVV